MVPSSYQRGLDAEDFSQEHYLRQGFDILARRWRCPYGEIDLVALRSSLLVFVEVKYRRKLEEAAYSLLPRQQMRIVSAAQYYLTQRTDLDHCDIRFDAVLISHSGRLQVIEDAFRP